MFYHITVLAQNDVIGYIIYTLTDIFYHVAIIFDTCDIIYAFVIFRRYNSYKIYLYK